MREGLRRELLIQKVIAQEVGSKVAVADQAVSDFFIANRSQFNLAEESYHIAQIVITPMADPNLTNRSGDDATTPQAATAKAQMLMERLKSGATFGDLAAGYSEDAETAPRGGDLGPGAGVEAQAAAAAAARRGPEQAARERDRGERGRRPHPGAGRVARVGRTARPARPPACASGSPTRCAGAGSSCCARRT